MSLLKLAPDPRDPCGGVSLVSILVVAMAEFTCEKTA